MTTRSTRMTATTPPSTRRSTRHVSAPPPRDWRPRSRKDRQRSVRARRLTRIAGPAQPRISNARRNGTSRPPTRNKPRETRVTGLRAARPPTAKAAATKRLTCMQASVPMPP